MRRFIAVLAMALLGFAIGPGAAAQDGELVSDPAKEAEFVAKINALRAEQGLAAYTVHDELAAKARDWSRTMAEAGDIWHSNLSDGITADWRRLGENVGMGGSVDSLHQAFVDSPSHYDNLIDPGFQRVGVGVTVDAEGTIFVSEVFMEPASQPATATPSPTAGTPPSEEPAPDETGAASDPESAGNTATLDPFPVPPAPEAAGEGSARVESVLDRLRALEA